MLDIDSAVTHFDRENAIFYRAADELQRKLATQFNNAFDECFTTTHATKLLQILGTIFRQPIIFAEVKHRYEDVVRLFLAELDMVKRTFDKEIGRMNANGELPSISVDRGFPMSVGTIRWVRQLLGRIEKIVQDFPYIDERYLYLVQFILDFLLNRGFFRVFATENGKYAMAQYESLVQILSAFEQKVFHKWQKEIESKISSSLKRSLLRREGDLLENNFDDACALREIKLFKLMEMENIPEPAIAFCGRADQFWVN